MEENKPSKREISVANAIKRNKRNKIIKSSFIFLLIIVIMWSISILDWTNGVNYEDIENLSINLGAKNIVLYTLANDCDVCVEQLELFGDYQDNIKNVVCASPEDAGGYCEKLDYFPTWRTEDNKHFVGIQTLGQLSAIEQSCIKNETTDLFNCNSSQISIELG